MKKNGFISLLLLMIVCRSFCQNPVYHARVISGNDMMNPAEVIQLYKDHRGYLWLLARTKIQRYDGKAFKTFSFNDACCNLQEDAAGKIWLAATKNVYRFTNSYKGFEKVNTGFEDSARFLAVTLAGDKRLYFLTQNRVLLWNEDSNQLQNSNIRCGNDPGSFPFLKSLGNFLFFRRGDKELVRHNILSGDEVVVPALNTAFLFLYNEDTAWVRQDVGSSALVIFKTRQLVPINERQFDKKFSDNRFFVTGSSNHFSFISFSDKGYFSYNPGTGQFTPVQVFSKGIPLQGSPPLNSFLEEDDGNIWFANSEGIININTSTHNIGLLKSNPAAGENWNADVRTFAEDPYGNIWFATANGFAKKDRLSGKVSTWFPKFEAGNYLNYSSVRSLAYCNGKLIIGQTEKGFWIFDPVKQNFTRPIFDNDSIKNVFEASFNSGMMTLANGNFLLFSRGVWLMQKNTFRITPVSFSTLQLTPRCGYTDDQGRIWLAGNNGIICCDSNFKPLYTLANKELGRWLNSIVQTGSNRFWVAAKSLYEIKTGESGSITYQSIFPELRNVHTSHLFKDSLDNIWMLNDNGIFRYVPKYLLLEKFDQGDNAQQYYAGISTHFRASDGTVYTGSTNGINYFIPERTALQHAELSPIITNVSVNANDSGFQISGTLPELSYYQNALVFDFIAPYIYNGDKVQYRYRLTGADGEWIYAGGNTSVRYTALKPGNYSFSVAASLNGKDWFEIKSPLRFSITPPFWQTWLFRILAVLGIATAVYLFIKKRERSAAQREAEKTAFQKLKADSYQHQLEMEQVINYFATAINEKQTVDEMLWDVAKNCIARLGFEDCVIYLKDETRNVLIQKAAWGPKTTNENKIINPIEIQMGRGVVGTVALTGKPEIIGNTLQDERYIKDDLFRLSEIAVPITDNGKTIGVIDSEHPEKDFYSKRHLQILTTIASLCVEKMDKIKAEQATRQKETEVLTLNKNLAASQLTALRAQMNPHFIFNALNSVQQYILQGNVDEANKYLSKFSRLQREILNNSDQQFIPLEKEKEMLELYLQLERLRFTDSFSYEIIVDEKIDTDEIMIPPMIIQPFVENAIWHGLMPKQGSKKVTIEFIQATDSLLYCTITDNGIGREAAAAIKQTGGVSKYKSKGLSLVYERLHILETQLNQPFSISIQDLKNQDGTAAGTKISLTLFIGS